MTREQKYTEQMQALGTYHPAFDPEIHMLAVMEREHQRTIKEWKAAIRDGEPKVEAVLYDKITQQRRDILAHRDALGLTPKALRRLKQLPDKPADSEDTPPTVLALIQQRHQMKA